MKIEHLNQSYRVLDLDGIDVYSNPKFPDYNGMR